MILNVGSMKENKSWAGARAAVSQSLWGERDLMSVSIIEKIEKKMISHLKTWLTKYSCYPRFSRWDFIQLHSWKCFPTGSGGAAGSREGGRTRGRTGGDGTAAAPAAAVPAGNPLGREPHSPSHTAVRFCSSAGSRVCLGSLKSAVENGM